jgi:hypothetical protein
MRLGTPGLSPAIALATALLLGGCGGGTKTVTAANTPAPAQTATTTTQPAPKTTTTATTAPASTAPAQTTTGGGTSGPTATTRTAPAPAFTKPEATGGEGLSGAEATVQANGFTVDDAADYHSDQALRVLLGTRNGSGDGYAQQAFFFVNNRYIGTDAKEPSAMVRVVAQSDTEVTLAYPLYRPSDPLCCPGGGQATVRFQLNNGQLTPLDPIPPASSKTGLSRQ